MKLNKKILIGLLTASCVVAGTFGLAACRGGNAETHEPVVTVGENGNVFVDGKDTGIAAKGESESLTVDYVLQTPGGIYVYYTDGSYQTVPYIAFSLSLTEANKITLPKTGSTAYFNVDVPATAAGVYAFDVELSNGVAECSFTVNGKTSKIGGGKSTSFVANLKAGDNLITVTTNLAAESPASLSISSIPAGGALSLGDNSVSLTKAGTFYAYTFTAAEDGGYTVSAPHTFDDPCVLCVTDENGAKLLDDSDWLSDYDDEENPTKITGLPFEAKANETVTLLIKAEPDGELAASYSLTISKEVVPVIPVSEKNVTSGSDEEFDDVHTEITVKETGTKVSLNVETAGKYVVSVFFNPKGYNESVSLNGHTFTGGNAATLSFELDLEAGDNIVTFVYETPSWEADITVWVNLTAKS